MSMHLHRINFNNRSSKMHSDPTMLSLLSSSKAACCNGLQSAFVPSRQSEVKCGEEVVNAPLLARWFPAP